MASMPCDVHHAPQPGRLCGIYPTLVTNGTRKSKYVRMCIPCSTDLLARHARDWVDHALRRELNAGLTCTSCGLVVEQTDKLFPFYATCYLNGKDRRDYTAMYCADCALKTAQEFELDV